MATDVGALLRELEFSVTQGASNASWLLRDHMFKVLEHEEKLNI